MTSYQVRPGRRLTGHMGLMAILRFLTLSYQKILGKIIQLQFFLHETVKKMFPSLRAIQQVLMLTPIDSLWRLSSPPPPTQKSLDSHLSPLTFHRISLQLHHPCRPCKGCRVPRNVSLISLPGKTRITLTAWFVLGGRWRRIISNWWGKADPDIRGIFNTQEASTE